MALIMLFLRIQSLRMKRILGITAIIILVLIPAKAKGQNIFRFDHIGSEDGLSQNTGNSILFDSKGFMWIGTWNGLNRYDGYEFKIFRSSPGNPSSFTNNRITKLWEDNQGFIWLETYDGYYHFFNPVTEVFHSIPLYKGPDVHNGAMKFFLQYSDNIIILGSSESGLYQLKYNGPDKTYDVLQLNTEGDYPISDDHIKFLHRDSENNVWVGTQKGLSLIPFSAIGKSDPVISLKYPDLSFSAVCETPGEIWFGTEESGIMVLDKRKGSTRIISVQSFPGFRSDRISHLYRTRTGEIITGFRNKGLMITQDSGKEWQNVKFHSENLDKIYEDRHNQVWLTALEFGVTRLDLKSLETRFYVITPVEIKPLTDLERPQFFEDTHDNLWLGLHGSGLGLYDRSSDNFNFFRNDPKDPYTISSNFVHCITEDRSGQLWIGTGQVLGGVEKVILENKAFEHHLLVKEPSDVLDNVSRAIIEDQNGYLWVSTKAGEIHLFDSTLKQKKLFTFLPGIGNQSLRNITYTFLSDSRGYLWIGSKGYGLSVSTSPLDRLARDYSDISFRRFMFSASDSSSIGNNNIYSVCEDRMNNIWIGTYGNGLSLVFNPGGKDLKFKRINQRNSNLSSDLIRHLLVDSSGNLWIATAFGVNLLEKQDIESGNYRFKVFLKNPADDKSLIYNDVIHIFEDSGRRIWLGTFGGGIELYQGYNGESASFRHYGSDAEISYGIVYGILEDSTGKIWYSTENGLVCLHPETGNSEVYNNVNGLGFNSFSENTCWRKSDGKLVFGGNLGIEIVDAGKLAPKQNVPGIELTNFLLFNKLVTPGQKGSPLKQSISFSDELILRYSQSSFSIDFSALDFLDPQKVQYTYKLDNFETSWNNIGNQHRATYTNLSPGSYVFRVKSIMNEGKSASSERILNIRISPPWWKTRLAYFLYAGLLMAVVILIYKAITRINRYKNDLAIEKKVNELKLQFYTNISHEIRTPLTLIIGPLEDMIADKSLQSGKKPQMGIMLKNARRMLHLTNQLLDFRKIQNNKMILKIREFDIVTFTREIFESFGPLARHKGIKCTLNSDFESFKVFADPNKLDIIIYNIISNAIKFTNQGKGVSVRIAESEKADSIDISVADEGPGIPQKSLSDIFTRYTILSNRDFAGTGIGLSLSYELARLHKGEILISSVVGKGSIFTIRLLKGNDHFKDAPGIAMDEMTLSVNEYTHSRESEENTEDDIRIRVSDQADKPVLLVVEDNNEILDYICQALKSYYTTIGAKNGEEGLHLARTMNPDIIITDIRMPGIDGMEMTRHLKEDFITSHIPVIMLTSKGDIKDQIRGIETGAEAYIVKPFNMDYLRTVVSNLLNQRAKVLAYFLGKKAEDKNIKISSKDGEFLKKTIKFIEDNYATDFQINVLSDHCNVSRTVFYNKIKGLTGYSPMEFIRRLKLDIAARLLDNGYNVSEAAFKTGFSDVKYFSRLFKSQFGHSPSRHRAEK
ncbi:MAG TPA: hybrid sensor histidine kinase/response regulator [Bacteroidales bacterium]|nr:hybrid sensor histidine kinase/response regulator [Bacteroidales bacterium]HBZ22631.1 hybrid sensor histidine kinase/response regulator [Bacteroidales bacterium]